MNGNSFIIFLLRSPLHRLMSDSTMLITVTGRKTGRAITIPVNYAQEGDTLWVVSHRERTWWRNVRGGAPVTLYLRGRQVEAVADALMDEGEVAAHLRTYLHAIPISARALRVRLENGQPDSESLACAARERVMVRVELKP